MKTVPLQSLVERNTQAAGEDKYPVLSITAGVGFVNQTEKFGKEIAGTQYVHYTVLKRGDFSYNKGNSKTYPQGCIYRQDEYDKAAVPNVFNSFRFGSPEANSDYYRYLFESGYLNHQLYRLINSGVRNDGLLNLYDDDFYSCKVPCPPLAEQKRIAEILGCCDRGIALKKELIAEKKRQKKALMQKLLDPDSGFRLPGFTGEWNNLTLGELGRCIRGVSYNPLEDILPNRTADSYCLLRANNFGGSEIDITDSVFVKKTCVSSVQEILPCDILISMSSGSKKAIGKTTIVRSISSKHCVGAFCAIFRSSRNAFVKHFFDSDSYQKQLSILLEGTNINNLTQEDIEGLKIKVPRDDRELQIVVNILSAADKEIDLLEQELAQQQQKKKSLMQMLLTGIARV